MSKFADPLDAAAHNEESFTQSSIEAVLKQGNQPQMPFKGTCYNCGDPLEKPRRFCEGEECAEEYEYVQKRKRINGHP